MRLPTIIKPFAVALVFASMGSAGPAMAHHGWSWTESGFFQVEGVITAIYLGNPHATLDIDVEGTIWRIELAPPSATTRSGFVEGVAAPLVTRSRRSAIVRRTTTSRA